MSGEEELGKLSSPPPSKSSVKKSSSFYGIRSHLAKFYELSNSGESNQNSPLISNGSSTSKVPCWDTCVKSICRLLVLVGIISIIVGVGILIGIFSAPVKSPLLKSSNPSIEQVDMKILRQNEQLETLQVLGIYTLLAGCTMLLLSIIISVVYLTILTCSDKNNGNNHHHPYVYDRGDY